jgi:hypothetical protein
VCLQIGQGFGGTATPTKTGNNLLNTGISPYNPVFSFRHYSQSICPPGLKVHERAQTGLRLLGS